MPCKYCDKLKGHSVGYVSYRFYCGVKGRTFGVNAYRNNPHPKCPRDKENRKMAKKKKFYGVKNGREIGVFTSWEDCKKQVHSYAGAEYKSFDNEQDAIAYIKGAKVEDKKTIHFDIDNCKTPLAIYVDGSYNPKTKEYGSGVVVVNVEKDKILKEISFGDKDVPQMRNIVGECMASITALRLCKKNNIKEISIFFDYWGIEKWATREWKAKNKFTQWYLNEYEELSKDIKVHFYKVKGHVGDKYNEVADRLSKDGCGVK